MDESFELKLSLTVCLGLSGLYVAYALLAEPSGGDPLGHWLGIFGTGLMAFTEIFYSLRKRTNLLRWAGPVRYWLSAHIFTGIVGPFMVLTHTAFQFRGLAGFTLFMTAVVAGSGFIGRYLYTAIPRSLAGVESSSADLVELINLTQAELLAVASEHSPQALALVQADANRQRQKRPDWALVLLRGWDDWRYRNHLRRQIRALEKTPAPKLAEVERLLLQRRARERQLRMIQAARRLLSVWHIAHVPMGAVLFTAVGVHIAAEIFFGAGLAR